MADQLIIRDMTGDASSKNLGRVAWLTSNRANLKGEYIMTRNNASAKLNTANPLAESLSIVGAPDYGSEIFEGALLSQFNWFDTGIHDAQELTMMVAFKPGDDEILLIGNFRGDNPDTNTALFLDSVGIIGQIPSYAGPLVSERIPLAPSDDWTIAMLRTTGSDNLIIKADLFRAGKRLAGTVNNTGQKRYLPIGTPSFAIGSSRGTTGANVFKGSARFLFADVWHRCLSDAEALAVAREWYAMGVACGQIV